MKKNLVIYHGNCQDGFTSAWVVRKALGSDIEFHAGFYQDPPPDVKGKRVYIVDFSYSREIMEQIVADAELVTHIDHHDTAIQAMQCYCHQNFFKFYSPENTESGAMLTWKYFFSEEVPDIIKYVDDRDRWQFKLSGSKEVSANMFSYDYTFENWDMLMNQRLEEQIADGTAIERRMAKDAKELLNVVVRRMNIGGYNVPVANVPYQYGSDMCSQLAIGEPFAAYYYDKPTHREFGLRSEPGAMHVGKIAKLFQGGGHEHASGFRRTFEEAQEFEIDSSKKVGARLAPLGHKRAR
jgi:oligoribonuclease NrnB/cAMP/cGMP phosphodiesterase (DHH superfamily)